MNTRNTERSWEGSKKGPSARADHADKMIGVCRHAMTAQLEEPADAWLCMCGKPVPHEDVELRRAMQVLTFTKALQQLLLLCRLTTKDTQVDKEARMHVSIKVFQLLAEHYHVQPRDLAFYRSVSHEVFPGPSCACPLSWQERWLKFCWEAVSLAPALLSAVAVGQYNKKGGCRMWMEAEQNFLQLKELVEEACAFEVRIEAQLHELLAEEEVAKDHQTMISFAESATSVLESLAKNKQYQVTQSDARTPNANRVFVDTRAHKNVARFRNACCSTSISGTARRILQTWSQFHLKMS